MHDIPCVLARLQSASDDFTEAAHRLAGASLKRSSHASDVR